VRIGKLRHRVEIQEFTTVIDDDGYPTENWGTIATVWASVEPVSGKEYWAAAAVQAETTVKVTMRYRDGITTAHRLRFGGRVYDIKAVINVEERNRVLELMCTAKDE
jgi:SPP1 family predicted phage head-tail adaptor